MTPDAMTIAVVRANAATWLAEHGDGSTTLDSTLELDEQKRCTLATLTLADGRVLECALWPGKTYSSEDAWPWAWRASTREGPSDARA